MSGGRTNDDSLDKLRTMKITSLDDDEGANIIDSDANGDTFDDAFDEDEDEDEDDEEDEESVPVTLGFVEKPTNEWSLLRHLFPSKAGGTPAWLDPKNLPSGRSCVCDLCGEPLQFLLQVYAPLSEKDSTFHRTLFVFMCPSMSCLLQDQHEQWKHHLERASRRCSAANCRAPIHFTPLNLQNTMGLTSHWELELHYVVGVEPGKEIKFAVIAGGTRYCSEKHQAIHWRTGHRVQCRELNVNPQVSDSGSVNGSADIEIAASKTLWPQFEIVNEDESEFDLQMSNIDKLDSTQLIEPLSNVSGPANSVVDSDEGDDDKKSWVSFHRRITRAPEQVLRYSRYAGSKPLWPMSSGRPSATDIPKCSFCSSHRAFEFQILPQLLYYFAVKNDVDSLDWATITVYTCEASCEGSLAYKDEFAWVQLVSQSTTRRR